MRLKKLMIRVLSIMTMALALWSCSQSRQVVPCDVDTDEIYKPLASNEEEEGPEGVSFGKERIPGFIFDYDMTTDNSDVYVFLENLTVLDVNPKITQNLLDFIQEQMKEYGFASDSLTFAPDKFEQILAQGLNYTEATGKIIEDWQNEFNSQLHKIEEFSSPFNARFQVYPLYLDKGIVTYRLYAYCYTGGAHGMTINYVRSYELASGKLLNFSDIVKPGSEKTVREEIAAHMAYSYPIYENITTVDQYIDSLNVWLDNFNSDDGEESTPKITAMDYPVSDAALIEQGLVCVYQMYELTPGSDGCPVVVIPYKDIKGCLTY